MILLSDCQSSLDKHELLLAPNQWIKSIKASIGPKTVLAVSWQGFSAEGTN